MFQIANYVIVLLIAIIVITTLFLLLVNYLGLIPWGLGSDKSSSSLAHQYLLIVFVIVASILFGLPSGFIQFDDVINSELVVNFRFELRPLVAEMLWRWFGIHIIWVFHFV